MRSSWSVSQMPWKLGKNWTSKCPRLYQWITLSTRMLKTCLIYNTSPHSERNRTSRGLWRGTWRCLILIKSRKKMTKSAQASTVNCLLLFAGRKKTALMGSIWLRENSRTLCWTSLIRRTFTRHGIKNSGALWTTMSQSPAKVRCKLRNATGLRPCPTCWFCS